MRLKILGNIFEDVEKKKINGRTYYRASEVLNKLGYDARSHSKVLTRKCSEAISVKVPRKNFNPKNLKDMDNYKNPMIPVAFIYEADIYNLIMYGKLTSKKREYDAEGTPYDDILDKCIKFGDWVRRNVLPRLRITGIYVDNIEKVIHIHFKDRSEEEKEVIRGYLKEIKNFR